MVDFKGGYAGRLLHIDLSRGKVVKESLADKLVRNYLGGRGFTSRLLYENVPAAVDPLDSDNVLTFATGPLGATPAPSCSRFTVGAKSPLTGGLGDANCGGFWNGELKWAGYDALLLHGRSEKPIYIWIDDDDVELMNADDLWGKTSFEAEDILRHDLGDRRIQIVSIGQAGENLVRYACVCSGGDVAGRTGMGAVMGSKKVKAIAVRGSQDVRIAHPKELQAILDEFLDILLKDAGTLIRSKYGTSYVIGLRQKQGTLQTKNLWTGVFDGYSKIEGEALREKHMVRMQGHLGCRIRHKKYVYVFEGEYAGCESEGLEYDSIQAFGSKCLNSDLASIIRANWLSNAYGLDVISMGDSIAFAMECYEKGILASRDTGGLEIKWGDPKIILQLIEMTAFRRGFGDLLAEGCRRAAQALGKGAERYAMQIKGLEMDSADPRGEKSRALGYAVGARGCDHLRFLAMVPFTPDDAVKLGFKHEFADPESPAEKGVFMKWGEDVTCITEVLGVCQFSYGLRSTKFENFKRLLLELTPRLYWAVTGIEITAEDLIKIGERVVNTERVFNVREGFTRKDDTLPDRFLEEPMPEGPIKGKYIRREELNSMLDDYYAARGWDKFTGTPRREKLVELGLHDMVEHLQALGKLPA